MAMILVTGATGKVGRHVTAALSARDIPVRALSRSAGRSIFPGVVPAKADFGDPDTLAPHLDGVDAAFLVWPFTSIDAADDLAPRVVALLARHVERIVLLSAQRAADAPDSFWARVERLVEASRAQWTISRPTGFASNTLMWANQIRSGDIVRWPYGTAARSLVDERDIAAVAVRTLTETHHGGQRYELTGPAALTQIEQVDAIGAALNRNLSWVEQPRDEAADDLAEMFGAPAFARSALDVWAGFVAEPEPVTTTVADITGVPARPFAAWAADHAGAFR
jgi:uncharacterized protein YbjT (DUF2867 family)